MEKLTQHVSKEINFFLQAQKDILPLRGQKDGLVDSRGRRIYYRLYVHIKCSILCGKDNNLFHIPKNSMVDATTKDEKSGLYWFPEEWENEWIHACEQKNQ